MKKFSGTVKTLVRKLIEDEQGNNTLEAAIIITALVIIVSLAALGFGKHATNTVTNSGTAVDTNYQSTVTGVEGLTVN